MCLVMAEYALKPREGWIAGSLSMGRDYSRYCSAINSIDELSGWLPGRL
jgi:hypothetical protein